MGRAVQKNGWIIVIVSKLDFNFMAQSRTTKSLKNAEVSVVYYALNLLVGFWSRRVFYQYLGSEVLGLDTTASTLLTFLNLAELGVGTAIGFFLYQPIFDKDTLKINEIVSLQGWIYRRVAFVIMGAALILMCFFPWIFQDIKIPKWYPYATFSVMLFGTLLGYFANYRQCVLQADQAGYKVTRVTSGAALGFKIFLILALPYVSCPFILYIGTNLLGSIFGCLWLNHVLKKNYPWLHNVSLSGKELLKKYPEILRKTGQIFFHKITTMIVLQVAPLIMYAFTSLTQVAYYGNYLVIIDKSKEILYAAFAGTGAGIGNLIASHDRKHILEVFWELIDSRLCISSSFILILGMIVEPLISIWLSPNYLLGSTVLFLVCFNSWLFINRSAVDSYIGGYGMYQDIWAPVVEAVINLGCAILLGHLYGLAGVLMGGIISTLVIIYVWKPYFLFVKGIKLHPLRHYFIPMLWRWGLVALNVIFFEWLDKTFRTISIDTFPKLFVYAIILSVIIIPVFYLEFYLLTPGMRHFHKRMAMVIKSKLARK